MKKKTIIIIVLCVLVATVIALSIFGVIGPVDSGSFAGYTGVPTVSLPNAEDMNPYYGSRTFA